MCEIVIKQIKGIIFDMDGTLTYPGMRIHFLLSTISFLQVLSTLRE